MGIAGWSGEEYCKRRWTKQIAKGDEISMNKLSVCGVQKEHVWVLFGLTLGLFLSGWFGLLLQDHTLF